MNAVAYLDRASKEESTISSQFHLFGVVEDISAKGNPDFPSKAMHKVRAPS